MIRKEKRIMIQKFLERIIYILPGIMIAGAVLYALSGYTEPVYAVPKHQPLTETETTASGEVPVSSAKALETENSETVGVEAETESESIKESIGKGKYDLPDGKYYGEADGYGGRIKVCVKLEDGSITDIKVENAEGEDPAFLNRAKKVIQNILHRQDTDVDTVSEATYSSRGIIGAVRNALQEEKNEEEGADAKERASSDSSGKKKKKSTPKVKKTSEPKKYKDGTYTGSADGFGGKIKVKVTIRKGKIKKIKVVSASGEGTEYLKKAKTLIKKMLKKQTTNVDAVSGATYSSAGLINAVRNALKKAGSKTSGISGKLKNISSKSSEEKKAQESGAEPGTNEKENPQIVDESAYADGEFEGTGEGFEGDIKVKVSLQGGKIVDITILSAEDDDPFFSNACTLLDTIVQKNGTDVDVVAGASFSSRGILSAVEDALSRSKAEKDARDKGEDQKQPESETTALPESEVPEEAVTETIQTQETDLISGEIINQEPSPAEPEKTYHDGDYQASGTCEDSRGAFYTYTITGKVTIKDGKITDIHDITADISNEADDNEYEEDLAYLGRAQKKLIPKITEKGTLDGVDAVSGATCSSRAVMDLCRDALKQALY